VIGQSLMLTNCENVLFKPEEFIKVKSIFSAWFFS